MPQNILSIVDAIGPIVELRCMEFQCRFHAIHSVNCGLKSITIGPRIMPDVAGNMPKGESHYCTNYESRENDNS